MKNRILFSILFFLLSGIYNVRGYAADLSWPRWRGPNGDGISKETNWDPEALAEGPKILWNVNIGTGYSDISIRGNRLYAMGLEGKTNTICA
jgi:hypothetical protein